MAESSASSNSRRYNQRSRPQTSYSPNTHFPYQQNENEGQSPSPLLSAPQSNNSNPDQSYPKRTDEFPIAQLNKREKYFHPFHHTEKHLPYRQWSNTDSEQYFRQHHSQYFKFHLVCYNILAQALLEINSRLYGNCFRKNLQWYRRKERLLKELLRQDADIICLQEMQNDHYEYDFRPRLMEFGYESIYIKRTGDKSDGCCLFYKVNRLRLIESKAVPFYQSNIQLLDRDNCGLIALFQPLTPNATSEDQFCVATTHLLFSPKRGDIKLAQVQYFLAEIDRLATKDANSNSYYPIIICGDFNTQPQSPLYHFLINGYIKYDSYRCIEISGQIPSSLVHNHFSHPLPSNELLPSSFVTAKCRFPTSTTQEISTTENDDVTFQTFINQRSSSVLTHDNRLTSVYDCNDVSDVTTCINDESNLVDYIFYTQQNNDPYRLNLLGRYDLYKQNQMTDIHLPNHQFASDHFLLAAKFALKLTGKTKN